jgi:hypothetical protein
MKLVKLKNKFTGDIVFCKDIKDITEANGMKFIKVYKDENPSRTFLVNLDAFVTLDK